MNFLRLVNQGGVQLNGEKLSSNDINKVINSGDVLKIGKKRFLKLVIKERERVNYILDNVI